MSQDQLTTSERCVNTLLLLKILISGCLTAVSLFRFKMVFQVWLTAMGHISFPMLYMTDNLISQDKEKPSKKFPPTQTLCNDVANVLCCSLMLICWSFLWVCVSVRAQLVGIMSSMVCVVSWAHDVVSCESLCTATCWSTQERCSLFSAWLKAVMDGCAFHRVLTLEVKRRKQTPSWSRQECPRTTWSTRRNAILFNIFGANTLGSGSSMLVGDSVSFKYFSIHG